MIGTITLLVIFGLLLIMLETFLPGWVAGILGSICLLIAIYLSLAAEELRYWPSWGRVLFAAGIIFGSSGVLIVWLRFFATRLFAHVFTLQSFIPSTVPEASITVGTDGVALTELRPLGRAEFGRERREVRCLDGFAPAGSPLRVTAIEPGNLVVRLI